MGKRSRRRQVPAEAAEQPRWQTARVRVDDATWAEFRRGLGERSVAQTFGAYVEAEVARARLEEARRPALTEQRVVELLERIETAKATLEALTKRLERLDF